MIHFHRFLLVVTGLLLLTIAPVFAEEEGEAASTASMEHNLDLNYRGFKAEGNPASASEYTYTEPGLGFGLLFKGHVGKKHLYLDVDYINDRDYLAEGHLDVNGRFKLNLSSQRLWHNLEHIPYTPGTEGARNNASTSGTVAQRVTFEDQNPADEYGLRVEMDKAEVITKLGNYPAHLRLKYWRLQKEGEKQLRFAEEGHDSDGGAKSCNVCHLQSETRTIDRETEEFSGAIDAHLGYVDIAFEQLLRTLRVHDDIPVDDFYGHNYGNGTAADPDLFQHSEDPESQLLQSSVTMRTALSGGLVVDGGYTYGKRENNSDLASSSSTNSGVDNVYAEAIYHKVVGNVSYTPAQVFNVNMRYRMLDYDSKNSDTVTAAYFRTGYTTLTFPVRDSIDVNRYEYAATASWRPIQHLTVKGEFQRETIVRGSTGEADRFSGANSAVEFSSDIDYYWELPDRENIDQYRLSLTLRPFRTSAFRINSWYRYMTDDDPAYGTSYDDRHEAFFGVNYSSKSRWGLTATARALQEKNEDFEETVWITNGTARYADSEVSDRQKDQQSLDLGFWLNPFSRVSTGLDYGYSRVFIEQDILFGSSDANTGNFVFDNIQSESEYLQTSQNISGFVNVQWLEALSTRVEGYYVRSLAKFSPNYFSTTYGTYPADSTGISEISRLDVIQQGLTAAINLNAARVWTIGLSYGIDDYDARNSDIYDGTTQTCMISMSRSW